MLRLPKTLPKSHLCSFLSFTELLMSVDVDFDWQRLCWSLHNLSSQHFPWKINWLNIFQSSSEVLHISPRVSHMTFGCQSVCWTLSLHFLGQPSHDLVVEAPAKVAVVLLETSTSTSSLDDLYRNLKLLNFTLRVLSCCLIKTSFNIFPFSMMTTLMFVNCLSRWGQLSWNIPWACLWEL